jgi:hypothetical protein
MRRVCCAALVVKLGNEFKILLGKPEGKKRLARVHFSWIDDEVSFTCQVNGLKLYRIGQ